MWSWKDYLAVKSILSFLENQNMIPSTHISWQLCITSTPGNSTLSHRCTCRYNTNVHKIKINHKIFKICIYACTHACVCVNTCACQDTYVVVRRQQWSWFCLPRSSSLVTSSFPLLGHLSNLKCFLFGGCIMASDPVNRLMIWTDSLWKKKRMSEVTKEMLNTRKAQIKAGVYSPEHPTEWLVLKGLRYRVLDGHEIEFLELLFAASPNAA